MASLSLVVAAALAVAAVDDPEQATTAASALAEAAKSVKLHEAPEGGIEIPPGRPDWIGRGPDLSGKVHKVPVASGPYAEDAEAKRALDDALVTATNHYIADQLGSELAPQLIRFNARTIRKRFLKQDNIYHDVARYSVGWMHEQFALLEFDQKFRDEIDRRWTQIKTSSRLTQVGLFSGAALLMLGSVFGYFRVNNATRGYYSGRLKFMAAAAIMATVVASAVVAQWIHWL